MFLFLINVNALSMIALFQSSFLPLFDREIFKAENHVTHCRARQAIVQIKIQRSYSEEIIFMKIINEPNTQVLDLRRFM